MNINITLSSGSQSWRTMDEAIGIIDHPGIRKKGCGKILKSSKEKSTSKVIHSGCGHRGVLHDMHNCPNFQFGYVWINFLHFEYFFQTKLFY